MLNHFGPAYSKLSVEKTCFFTFGLEMNNGKRNKVTKEDNTTTLLVQLTGKGKSLVRDTAALQIGGVILTVVPLVMLGSDQAAKMEGKIRLSKNKNIFVYYVDKIHGALLLSTLLDLLNCHINDTLSTIFLFASPQILS